MSIILSEISHEDKQDLLLAKKLLENPGFMAKLVSLLGEPIEFGLKKLPDKTINKIHGIAHMALDKAYRGALLTLASSKHHKKSSNFFHKFAVATTGAMGGAVGLPALVVELPTSTTLMMRSIADIARSHGEDLTSVETQIACIEVFALGGTTASDDAAETGYFLTRAMLSQSIGQMGQGMMHTKIVEDSSSLLIRMLALVAKRFGVQVTEKMVAQSIPVLGAFAGASINTLFMSHFQSVAQGHFIIRRLEKKYGETLIRSVYQNTSETILIKQ